MTRTRILIFAAVLLVGLVLVWAFRPSALLVEVQAIDRGPIVIGFEEEGRTQLRERWQVTAPVAGELRRVTLREGDTVSAGEPVAELLPAAAALVDPANRKRLQAEGAAARDAATAAAARARAAEAAAELSRTEATRIIELGQRRLVSASAIDVAKAAEQRDQATLASARAESAAAEHRLRSIESMLEDEGRGGSGTVLALPAPVSGLVIRRLVEGPAPVAVGAPILEIGDPGQLELVVEVLSTQAVSVKPGMPARVLRWGGDGELRALVRRVEPGGFTKISALGVEEQRVRVILDPDGEPERWAALGDGYRIEVGFVTWQRDDVLRVPASALYRDDDGWSVFVAANNRARARTVTIGRRGADWAELEAGLAVGENVVLFPDSRLSDGARLAVTSAAP
jgi:HlyD family secretion protein